MFCSSFSILSPKLSLDSSELLVLETSVSSPLSFSSLSFSSLSFSIPSSLGRNCGRSTISVGPWRGRRGGTSSDSPPLSRGWRRTEPEPNPFSTASDRRRTEPKPNPFSTATDGSWTELELNPSSPPLLPIFPPLTSGRLPVASGERFWRLAICTPTFQSHWTKSVSSTMKMAKTANMDWRAWYPPSSSSSESPLATAKMAIVVTKRIMSSLTLMALASVSPFSFCSSSFSSCLISSFFGGLPIIIISRSVSKRFEDKGLVPMSAVKNSPGEWCITHRPDSTVCRA